MIEITPALTRPDRARIARLDRALFASGEAPIKPSPIALLAWIPERVRPVGFLVARPGFLDRFGVLPSGRGRGIGAALLEAFAARSPGPIDTYTAAWNHTSARALVRAGYLPIGFQARGSWILWRRP